MPSLRGIVMVMAGAAVVYLALVLWNGADRFTASLRLLQLWLVPVLLTIVFSGYGLRFLRWQWYLKQLGYRVPWRGSFRIFLASFALTASPGKVGESVKSLMLKQRYGVPVAPTLAGLFCERLTDALSVVVLAAVSVFFSLQQQGAILGVGLVLGAIVLLLQRPALLRKFLFAPLSRSPKLVTTLTKIDKLLTSASALLTSGLLLGGTALAAVAWGLEGICLYIIFQNLGAGQIILPEAVLVHTLSSLLGALSMLPGGIGGAEASMISLSLFYGAAQATAITATFLIRLMTLWFAVAVGLVAALLEQSAPLE